MGRKIHKPEEIVGKLRQVGVLTAQGTPVEEAVPPVMVGTWVRCGAPPIVAMVASMSRI